MGATNQNTFLQAGHRFLPAVWIVAFMCLATMFYYVASTPIDMTSQVLSDFAPSSLLQPAAATPKDRPLVTYAFYDTPNARANLGFFLRHGLHDDADFVFILNGATHVDDNLIPTERENVRVVRRENVCFDLGAHGEVLRKDDLWKKYKRFITMNASVRGPFLPHWAGEGTKWTDLFLDKVTDKTKLVGLTFNCRPTPHVQSMLWATDAIGMQLLLDPARSFSTHGVSRGLGVCYRTMDHAVHGEIGTTSLITEAGYKVDVMETAFHKSRHFAADECTDDNSNANDPNYDGAYYGISINPYEAVFIKANRDISPKTLRLYTEWHDDMLEDQKEEEEEKLEKQHRDEKKLDGSGLTSREVARPLQQRRRRI